MNDGGRELELGDRVRLNELGIARSPKIKSRTGTVVSLPRYTTGSGTVGFRFDGNKMPTTIHRSYLEFDDAK